MLRFVAIDGLRAWMAWLVLAMHIVQQGLPGGGPAAWIKLDLGGQAVDTFIIISGFVITHLLIERSGGYLAYIIPRFMRLFPAFVVACALGAGSLALGSQWAAAGWFEPSHGIEYRNLIAYLPAHSVAHLLMLHGAIPNTVLPLSEYAFIPPGWSVSLEWQFYLVAPAVIWLCRTHSRAVVLVGTVAIMSVAYHFALRPLWDRPSFLVGTAKFFLIGIGCRFAAPYLAGRLPYVAATGLSLACSLLWIGPPSIAMWMLVYAFVLRKPDVAIGMDLVHVRVMRALLESRATLFLAERSYSTYLLHWPIITLMGAIATHRGVSAGPALTLWMLPAVPLVLVIQEVVYRVVERPGRQLGKRWALRLGAPDPIEIAAETAVTGNPHERNAGGIPVAT
ncbi:acyltransferase family protein [Sphingomonas sp.]|uniref:acyltransferase family protein n=1 Tax=Sphingomonas sp. TaxID=28214 RepID=UPI003CC51903